MFKKFLAFFAAMYLAVSFAAVDVNKASPADLDGLKGIGPAISSKIIDERKKGEFKDWNDFIERVKGIGPKNAVKFSAEGLTVSGASYKGEAAVNKKETKSAATKTEDKKVDVKSPTPASAAPASAAVKVDKKTKAEEAKAKADAKKAAAEAKSSPAKPAASAAKN